MICLKQFVLYRGNDASVAMAEAVAGSEEAFVQKMNEKAKELGMNDTTFKNCHGIDEDGHLTSSYDISLMSKALLNNYPEIKKYTSIWMDELRNGEFKLVNTNKLIRIYEGATGLKTGSTSLALYNLSASATRKDLSLIAVVMRAPSPKERLSNARTLLDYGFSTYEFIKTSKKDEVAQNVLVSKGVTNNLDLIYEKNTGNIVKKGEGKEVSSEIILNEKISAPIKKGDILGKENFYLNNELISTVNLVAKNDVEKLNIINMFNYVFSKWKNILR